MTSADELQAALVRHLHTLSQWSRRKARADRDTDRNRVADVLLEFAAWVNQLPADEPHLACLAEACSLESGQLVLADRTNDYLTQRGRGSEAGGVVSHHRTLRRVVAVEFSARFDWDEDAMTYTSNGVPVAKSWPLQFRENRHATEEGN